MADEETVDETVEKPKPRARRKAASKPKPEPETVKLPETIFGITPHLAVMHQALLRQLANARQGTASTKTRARL